MRISDWSSDVCSSDLPLARLFWFLEIRCMQAPCRGLCQSALRAALRQGCDHPVARPSAERECHPSPEQRIKATTAPSASDAVHALNASSGRAETIQPRSNPGRAWNSSLDHTLLEVSVHKKNLEIGKETCR